MEKEVKWEKEVKCPSTNRGVVLESGLSVHEDDRTACCGRGEILQIIPPSGNWVTCHMNYDTGKKVHNDVLCWALIQRCDGKKIRGLAAIEGSVDWIEKDPTIVYDPNVTHIDFNATHIPLNTLLAKAQGLLAEDFVDYHRDDDMECLR